MRRHRHMRRKKDQRGNRNASLGVDDRVCTDSGSSGFTDDAIRKRSNMEQKPLTIEELKKMAGQPVWCPDEEAYGIVMCDNIGQWAGVPFLHGVWYHDGIGVEFDYNIIKRKLKCYRVIHKKEIE